MGIFCQRWLVIYMTEKGPTSKVIVDAHHDLPFGVDDQYVAEDCERIVAIVDLPDDYEPQVVVMDDRELDIQLPKDDEEEDDAAAA
jgi:hypothetical protein